jgi:hypothetical protein
VVKFVERRLSSRAVSEGEYGLVEGNVMGDVDTFCGYVIATIAFVFCRITNENTRKRSWGEFVRSGGR